MTGRVWLGAMSLVAVPVFVFLLGTEAFGIVALVQTLRATLSILDFGLARTVNREVAAFRGPDNRGYIADVARTFEWIYWTVAIAIGLGISGMAGWIADSWLTEQSISSADLRMAVVLGGISLAARWPVSLYTGVLRGLERQVLQNAILIVAATTRIVLTILALVLISRTVYCFLVVQALANMMEVLLIGLAARRLVSAGAKGKFNLEVLRRVWRFAISFNLVGAIGTLVSGADKLLISNLLPLSALTYYSVCGTATGALQVVYLAAAAALFPRLSSCWQRQDLPQILRLYRITLRFTTYVCLGPVILLCFFPYEVLLLWTRSTEVASGAYRVLPVLAATILINCASSPAYNSIIAAGRTRVPLAVNTVSLPAMWIGCYLAIAAYGVIGAAACWLASNAASLLIYREYFRRSILQAKPFSLGWLIPLEFLLPAIAIGLISKTLLPPHGPAVLIVVWLGATVALYYVLGVFFMKGEERRMIGVPFLHSS